MFFGFVVHRGYRDVLPKRGIGGGPGARLGVQVAGSIVVEARLLVRPFRPFDERSGLTCAPSRTRHRLRQAPMDGRLPARPESRSDSEPSWMTGNRGSLCPLRSRALPADPALPARFRVRAALGGNSATGCRATGIRRRSSSSFGGDRTSRLPLVLPIPKLSKNSGSTR